jgi:AraC-type DNA-binding domain-containing proteins
MRDGTRMTTDPLSDALDLANARCVLTGSLIAGGIWGRRFERSQAVKFLAVVRGACLRSSEAGPAEPVRFEAGDVIITNGAPGIILASTPERLIDAPSALPERDQGGHLRLGEGDDFMMIGGLLELDQQRCGFLRESLPPLLHVRGQTEDAAKLRWLLHELAAEVERKRAGSATAITQLAKLLFVEALRLHIDTAAGTQSGWLTALDDRHISVALRGIHADPAHPWTLGELAALSGMSRTSFAVRFRNVVGIPPLTYLFDWRMRLAERELSETDRTVADIAWSLGYGSESAFSNAFRRARGLSPGRFRKAST